MAQNYKREELLACGVDVCRKHGASFTQEQFRHETGVSRHPVCRLWFQGGWSAFQSEVAASAIALGYRLPIEDGRGDSFVPLDLKRQEEHFRRWVADTAQNVPAPPSPKSIKTGKGESLVLVFSDWHYAKWVRVGDRIIYDMDIAHGYVETLLSKAKHLLEMEERGGVKFREIVVVILGDMATGMLIFPGQSETTEAPVPVQYNRVARDLLWCIKSLHAWFPSLPIRVYTVQGNHGRVKDSQEANWDRVAYDLLYIAVEQQHEARRWRRITMQKPHSEPHIDVQVGAKRLHCRHGGEAGRARNTAAAKAKFLGWAASLRHNADAVIIGHWHKYGIHPINQRTWLFNGSLSPADELADGRIAEGDTLPHQIMFGVHDDVPVPTWIRAVWTADANIYRSENGDDT